MIEGPFAAWVEHKRNESWFAAGEVDTINNTSINWVNWVGNDHFIADFNYRREYVVLFW